jgi:hypothetical protein
MPPAPASAPAGLSAMGASLAAVTAAVAAAYVPPELMAILAELPDLEEVGGRVGGSRGQCNPSDQCCSCAG